MAVTALILYLVWAFLAFGWRTIDQRRRTGDSGLRLHAQPNTAQWWAKIGFAIAILVGVAAPLAAVAGLDNVTALDTTWLHIAGIAVTLIGVLLTVAAQYSMGESWRIGVDPEERTELVTDGAFRLVRNPIFTAMLITATGLDDDHPQRHQHPRARRSLRGPRGPGPTRRRAVPPNGPRRPVPRLRTVRRTIRSRHRPHPLNTRRHRPIHPGPGRAG